MADKTTETEQKRKLACDSCKRKKLKCEWEEDNICIRCSRSGTECIPQPTTQRKKREKKPNTYLSSLEDRLRRMESALLNNTQSAPKHSSSSDMESQAIVDDMSVLKIHDNGSTVFVGAASGFSIFSPQGLKWIAEKTGTNDFSDVMANLPHLPDSSKGLFGTKMWHPLSEQQQSPLPRREEAVTYAQAFFNTFATAFPLYNEEAFFDRFAKQYPVKSAEDPAWYANLNIIFAIGAVMKEKALVPAPSPGSTQSSPRFPRAENSIWWKWFRNATSMFIDLQFREGSLPAVQALVGMSFLLQTVPDPNPCIMVSTAALRLSQAIGLHRNLTYIGLTPSEIEQRRNTFWIGFLVERGVAFRMGRPSVIHEDDIGIDFPKETGPPGPASNHLRYMVKLGILQGRIYHKIYSAKSLTKSSFERLQRIGMLDDELQTWRDSIPEDIRPGNEIKILSDPKHMMPILMMHFAYFNALTIIHRVSNHHGPWRNKGDDPFDMKSQESGLNPRVFAGGAICVGAARSVIILLNSCAASIEGGDLNIVRIISYYPLTASLILFANVLQNPWDPQAFHDIELMKNVLKFVTDFIDEDDTLEAEFIVKTFSACNRRAEEFVKRIRAEGVQGPKRPGGDHEWSMAPKHARSNTATTSVNTFSQMKQESPSLDQNFYNISNPNTGSTFNACTEASSQSSIPFNKTQDSQFAQSNIFPTDLDLAIDNDPLAFLDQTQYESQMQHQIYHQSQERNLSATSTTFSTSEEQTPEFNVDDLLLPQDGASWFFPIDNQNQGIWDVYMGMGGVNPDGTPVNPDGTGGNSGL